MKILLLLSLILLTSCSYFKKEQLHTYDLRYTNQVGSSSLTLNSYFKLIERTKDWLIFLNYYGGNDTLFISNRYDLNGSLKDFRPNVSHKIKFVGKIIDESLKTLHIEGEYFVKTPVSQDYFYSGNLEIF